MSRSKKDFELNYSVLSPAQFGKLANPPVSAATVIKWCKQGLLNAHQTDGGHWKIILTGGESLNTNDFKKLKNENARLRSAMENIKNQITNLNI